MGKDQRAREAAERLRIERRWAWLKGLMAFTLAWAIVPFTFGRACFRDNEWPWDALP